ncbi:PRD domain-containing protein [Clostridium sp. 19966]|uniref:PRD domain-containing protein n=1 Tax=Clostridium sp. 19966 TaxID=2768166 RepID=UPI0028DF7DE1|nr:PRD domain-containing protein [Clostridium sp. 19966]MDT8716269.1 PRD domain-containing protein [Clostridium sp. 19966]
MKQYIISKVLNNNVVVAEENKENLILVGNGIGFGKKKGEKILENQVESIFIEKSSTQKGFESVLNKIDKEIVGICEEIISMCESELNMTLNDTIHVSLADHINFAFYRVKNNIKIENPFLSELRILYSKEYELAEKALGMINKNFHIKLPKDEVGFICMHINSAISRKPVADTLAFTKNIGSIMEFICLIIKKDLKKDSLAYMRTVTHIKFVVDRVINKKTIHNYLLDNIKKELYNEYALAIKVAIKIENLFSVNVCEDEVGYIALHLQRLKEV